MRKLIISNIMSLDGFIEGPNRNVMVLPMDSFFDEYNLERLRRADTLLLGANTYMGLKGYWPAVAENPELSPAVEINPDTADLHREIGQRNNQIRKAVVSDTLTEKDTPPWTETTTIVPRAEAHQVIADLKDQAGKDILVFGSRTLWNDLLAAELVDELHLMIGAGVLGAGTPAFDSRPIPTLRLLDIRRQESSNNVVLVYQATPEPIRVGDHATGEANREGQ
jgi:dihydrofolate reductase